MADKKIRVCNGRSCACFGAERIMTHIEKETGVKAGEKNEQYDLDYCICRGWCAQAPVVEVDDSKIIFDVETETIMGKIDRNEGVDNVGREIDIEDLLSI